MRRRRIVVGRDRSGAKNERPAMPKRKTRRRSNREAELVDSVDQCREACAHPTTLARLMADCNPAASFDAEVVICLGAMIVTEVERLQTALQTIRGEGS